MATARKDFRGRVLRKGEVQRASDKRYMYCYTDPFGRRKYIYANDLVTLREKETRLTKNQLDGLDTYVAGYATVNFVFDRYISLKTNLRETTRSNYLYIQKPLNIPPFLHVAVPSPVLLFLFSHREIGRSGDHHRGNPCVNGKALVHVFGQLAGVGV